MMEMWRLAEMLRNQRFRTIQEKQTQEDVERFLVSNGIPYAREKRLSKHDIPDFLIQGIALEVKTKYPRKAIYRQLVRYAKHDEVKSIILLTGTSMRLPDMIEGKLAVVVSLGEGWL